MNLASLDFSILGPALIAGLLVLSTHVPLGQQVLARGIIFIDLAVAQVAGLGVIAAHGFGWEPGTLGVQVAAVGAALLAALMLNETEKRWPEIQEALIGALFVLAASGGLLLLAGNPHGGEHLKELLVGQILWVSPQSLMAAALVYAAVLALWVGLRTRLRTPAFGDGIEATSAASLLRGPRLHPGVEARGARQGWRGGAFYVLFAICVTVSVQLVGIYLVFASLILPALAVRRLRGVRQLAWGYGIGATGYVLGIVLSALADLPTGAVVVYTLAAAALAAGRLRASNRPA
jgi:zinc/manganese transport system permease protein